MPLARGIDIHVPVIGANMDTVMGRSMMKTLSLEGAFGFLHRSCSIEEEAEHVRYVKHQHSFVVEDPLVLPQVTPLGVAKRLMESRGISGLLIETTKGSNVLAGILSHRDIPQGNDHDHKPIATFMTRYARLITAKPGISIRQAEQAMFDRRVEKLPIVGNNRQIKGLITMRDLRLSKKKPYSNKDAKGRLLVGATIGAMGDYMERTEALIGAGADVLLMDVAHADSDVVKKSLRAFRATHKRVPLVVGNVATAAGARFLVNLGADAVKVGIGPGRGCRTRLETGAGVPQLQAIREIFLAVGNMVPIIADGGIRHDKDIFLAIACGASSVMLGAGLSGTDESPGIITTDPATNQKMKIYRGMTSPEAVVDGAGNERAGEALRTPAEGQSVRVPYVGSVVDVIARIRGHLQSSVSYAGRRTLADAHKKITSDPEKYLIPLSEASRRESFER